MGDPAGVGPAVVAAALERLGPVARSRDLVVVGDPRALRRAATSMGRRLELVEVATPPWDSAPAVPRGAVAVAWPEDARGRMPDPGRPTAGSGCAQLAYLEAAVAALRAGQASALVTGPVSKTAIVEAGAAFTGHTEYLAEQMGLAADGVTMLFAGPRLRVALVTTHMPLRQVPAAIVEARVAATLARVAVGLERLFGLTGPRIVALGLNPHAGEGGLFGDEELAIRRAIAAARKSRACRRSTIDGPVPSEAGLAQTLAGRYDCAVAMYHDQATIACKLLDARRSDNVTLGLPFLRASVAHGVAYDAARAGSADPGSMIAALAFARRVAARAGRG
jgi:4-hydroxythreonine-4-phosphate dehydrogenase